jgi:hypothetical protein
MSVLEILVLAEASVTAAGKDSTRDLFHDLLLRAKRESEELKRGRGPSLLVKNRRICFLNQWKLYGILL